MAMRSEILWLFEDSNTVAILGVKYCGYLKSQILWLFEESNTVAI